MFLPEPAQANATLPAEEKRNYKVLPGKHRKPSASITRYLNKTRYLSTGFVPERKHIAIWLMGVKFTFCLRAQPMLLEQQMEAENCGSWACTNSPQAENTMSCQKAKLRVCSYHPAGSQITHFTQFSDFSAYKSSDALLGWWYRTPYDLASVVNCKYWCFSMLGSPFSLPSLHLLAEQGIV